MNNKLELFLEEVRRDTYKKWVFSSDQACSSDKMAEAGFIFTGSSREPDSVQCFFCGKCLDGWEATDNPWLEHLKHAAYCEFAQKQTPQDLWTLNEWLELFIKYRRNLIIKSYEEAKKHTMKQFEALSKLINSF